MTTNLDEIVNKAIPISFPGVNCAATVMKETQKALMRREQLKENILTLLETINHEQPVRTSDKYGVGRTEEY